MNVVKCYRCGHKFAEGETGFIQVVRKIKTRGTRVTNADVEVVVCNDCR